MRNEDIWHNTGAERTFRDRNLAETIALFLISALLTYVLAGSAQAGSFHEITDFGSNPGDLGMFTYIPNNLPAPHPLVVVLHGCSQSGSTYATDAGWTAAAEKYGFAVLLPEQREVNNKGKCFNWFEANDMERDKGEALSIKQMIEKMKSDHQVNPAEIYVTGLSAGGCMTAVLLATYPEDFAGGAIIAGIPYKCGVGDTEGKICMFFGKSSFLGTDVSPAQWGDRVRNASGHSGPWPKVSIWQGTTDYIVREKNATELVEQWTNVHGIDQRPDVEDTVAGYPHRVFKNDEGNSLVETYLIQGMGHGTPVDPGPDACQCGSAAPFILDVGICSTYHILNFWDFNKTSDGSFALRIIAPPAGETVSGTVAVRLGDWAPPNIDVSRCEFYVDGKIRRSGSSPQWDWDTRQEVNGEHILVAKAFDVSNHPGVSEPISVKVKDARDRKSGLIETFSDSDGNNDLLDETGWQTNGWAAASANHTMSGGSRSVLGSAASGVGDVTGPITESLERKIFLGDSPKLSYFRKLDLRAMVNRATSASFRVLVDGTVVDEETVTWGNYAEPEWTERPNIDLSSFGNKAVTLTLEVAADSNVHLEVSAKAWIDDIQVSY